MSQINYKSKYLKYKAKYLFIKNNQIGGAAGSSEKEYTQEELLKIWDKNEAAKREKYLDTPPENPGDLERKYYENIEKQKKEEQELQKLQKLKDNIREQELKLQKAKKNKETELQKIIAIPTVVPQSVSSQSVSSQSILPSNLLNSVDAYNRARKEESKY
jgi:hypothetical protein